MILFLILISCKQEKECYKFRTGEFIYAEKNRLEKIVRNDSLQIETNPNNGIEIHTSIEWTSECEYVMTYEKILNYENENKLIGKKIYVEIIETKGNRIKVHAKSETMNENIEFIKTD